MEFQLDSGGSNLSLGQRQLICIARAVLTRPKILLMDEATANIDEKTDHLIQSLIKSEFPETTILTIAHRLNTIIQYDRVMVLDQGLIAEFDTPSALLSSELSLFTMLVKSQGNAFFEKMQKLASDKNLSQN